MRTILTSALLLAAALAFAGCSPAADKNKPDNTGGGNVNKGNAGGHEGHDHDGDPHDLGKQTINGVEISVTQIGHFEANGEWTFELAYGGKVVAVRGWVGKEDGTGTAVAKAHAHGDDIDVHIDTAGMDKLPEGAMFWLEVEVENGQKAKGSYKLAADEHDDHDHDH